MKRSEERNKDTIGRIKSKIGIFYASKHTIHSNRWFNDERVTNFPIFCCIVNSSFRNRKNETEKIFILYFRSLVPQFYCVNGLFLILEIGTNCAAQYMQTTLNDTDSTKWKEEKNQWDEEKQRSTEEKNKANK